MLIRRSLSFFCFYSSYHFAHDHYACSHYGGGCSRCRWPAVHARRQASAPAQTNRVSNSQAPQHLSLFAARINNYVSTLNTPHTINMPRPTDPDSQRISKILGQAGAGEESSDDEDSLSDLEFEEEKKALYRILRKRVRRSETSKTFFLRFHAHSSDSSQTNSSR